MRLDTLGMTAAAIASIAMLSACNKPATAPATPAASASVPAATVAPPTVPTAAAPPTPSTAASNPTPMAAGRRGGRVRQACAAEIAKFCTAGEKPWKCLKPHKTELSQACQAARAQAKAAHQARMDGGG